MHISHKYSNTMKKCEVILTTDIQKYNYEYISINKLTCRRIYMIYLLEKLSLVLLSTYVFVISRV